ncbi:hypothetical protein RR46_01186 [Papilio xuthus]|uniref:Uncharacterized protein n=1 Tax=Papilio xuthus TaxID=66420 RepID=A0A0N1INA3_PAPXU|nr:hypothetical protein RR46_01186 [Papilio xuthus]
MEMLIKSVIIVGAACIAATFAVMEYWEWRNVPEAYNTHGQRRRRD